jgi:hypothetical protein
MALKIKQPRKLQVDAHHQQQKKGNRSIPFTNQHSSSIKTQTSQRRSIQLTKIVLLH